MEGKLAIVASLMRGHWITAVDTTSQPEGGDLSRSFQVVIFA